MNICYMHSLEEYWVSVKFGGDFCVDVVYSGEYDACDVYSECISTPGELEKYARPRWESNLRPLEH
jgi:hypothetical protein